MGQNGILQLREHREGRTVCISDIHGNLTLFRRLLELVDLRPEDRLMLLGDYIERGRENAATVEYLMELSCRPDTWMIRGNLDTVCDYFLHRAPMEEALHYFNRRWNSLITELAAREGYTELTEENFPAVRDMINRKYGHMFSFFADMPVAAETAVHVFSHAGVAGEPDWRRAGEDRFVRNYDFYRQRQNPTGKCVVFGHMPTFNMPDSGPGDMPVLLPIIGFAAIDGGNNVKKNGQLNALLIDWNGTNPVYSVRFVCDNPTAEVLADFDADASLPFVKTPWPQEELTVLRRGEFFTECLVGEARKAGRVKNEHYAEKNRRAFFTFSTVSCDLTVRKGETVYVLDNACGGYTLVKNLAGVIGWVPKNIIGG